MAGSIEKRRSGGLRTLDSALVVAGVIGGIFVVLWAVRAVVGLALFAFKVVVFVVVVALIVRLVHLVTRGRSRT
ncbi:MAG TPA: hypothetical protein VE991_04430 [Acidimicrobiales bacterium]|nr:hypothetical protein [Acidimicrobiales bacterium]